MNDEAIVDLFLKRDESSVSACEKTYGAYAHKIAFDILGSSEDTDECINDLWLRLWNSIPPNKPKRLNLYIAKIVRNLAFDRCKKMRAEKRGGGKLDILLGELNECIPSHSIEAEIDAKELTAVLENFLENLSPKDRNIFVRRYWYSQTVGEIAQFCLLSESNIKSNLHRSRLKLKKHLESEGIKL